MLIKVTLSRLLLNFVEWMKVNNFFKKPIFTPFLDTTLSFGTKESQAELLQKVLEQNDDAAEEESLPAEFQSSGTKGSGARFGRKSTNMSEMSGGDSRHYTESKAKKKKVDSQHPLFKAFR